MFETDRAEDRAEGWAYLHRGCATAPHAYCHPLWKMDGRLINSATYNSYNELQLIEPAGHVSAICSPWNSTNVPLFCFRNKSQRRVRLRNYTDMMVAVMTATGVGSAFVPGLMPGEKLRLTRLQQGMTMRDVHSATIRLAMERSNEEFIIAPSRLSAIERRGTVPSIYKLQALAHVYNIDLPTIAKWYGA